MSRSVAEFEVAEAEPSSWGWSLSRSAPCAFPYTGSGVERKSDSDQSREARRV